MDNDDKSREMNGTVPEPGDKKVKKPDIDAMSGYLEDGVVSLHVGQEISSSRKVDSKENATCPHCGENIVQQLAGEVLDMAGHERAGKPSAGSIKTCRNSCPACNKGYTAVFQKLNVN